MRIRALCVVKNEADIIEQTLRAAASWADAIYVLDNGSHDGTWQAVQELARELPAVIPYKQNFRPFDDAIRGEILSHYIERAESEDWWCILDADEFYVDDPRQFLKEIPHRYKAVWHLQYIYLFTDDELALYQWDPEQYHVLPVETRMRHYIVDEFSEMRFFRHRDGLTEIPVDARPVFSRRIRLKHFMYRSPEQITMRLETRREPMERGEWLHERKENWTVGASVGHLKKGPAVAQDFEQSWRDRVAASSDCYFDWRDGTYAAGPIWSPPTAPSSYAVLNAYARRAVRAIRRHVQPVGSDRLGTR